MKFDLQAGLALAAMIERVASAAKALEAAKEATERANALGREATLDDIKSAQVFNKSARDVLVRAIEDAERG